MPASPHLIERSGDLKRDLVLFAQGPRFRRDFLTARVDSFGHRMLTEEADAGNFLDEFLLQYRLPDGRRVIDHFLDQHPELPEAERAMLQGWKDPVEGVFQIERREGDALVAVNLIDELTYRIYSNMGPGVFSQMRPGSFLITRAVPVEDEWVLSGYSRLWPASDRLGAYRLAAQLATLRPALSFRNPQKLEQAWELQRADRDQFLAFFGSDMVIIPGRELKERLRAYEQVWQHELRDAQDRSATEREQQESDRRPPLLTSKLPQAFYQMATVGAIYDEAEGLSFFPEFGLVEETFARPELAAEPAHEDAVLEYLNNPDIGPLPLRRLGERDPEHADRVFRTILRQPDFSWERDGEALLRRHKPRAFDREPQPSVTVLSEPLARALRSAAREEQAGSPQRHPGRNDPCPCGSGKKFKRCCGR
jgi:uncharacterized protein YecA (UPF0149 family)